MMKKIGIISLCIILFLCVGCGKDSNNGDMNNTETMETGEVVNKNIGVIGTKIVEGFRIENTSLVTKENTTSFVSYMTNTNKEVITVKQVKLIMNDKDGEEVTSIDLNLNREMDPNETAQLNAIFKLDLTSVSNIEYEIIK